MTAAILALYLITAVFTTGLVCLAQWFGDYVARREMAEPWWLPGWGEDQ